MNHDYNAHMENSGGNPSSSDRLWYIRVSGTVYGPFDDRTVWTYVQEGRVTALSELSLRPETGYQPAKNWLEITHWFHAPTVQAAPEPVQVQQPRYTSLMLVMAEIRSGRSMAFLQTLQSLGDAQRIGDTIWLVQSNTDPDHMKSVLGPTLSVSDRLFIVDATYSDFSAYNLGPEVEGQLNDIFSAQQTQNRT